MIAYLSGLVREIRETSAILVTSGIGFEVFCPATTLSRLKEGEQAELHTRHIVREDAQLLFGFIDTDSVRLFDLLVSVTGVGPKLGLALLSALPVSALAQGLLSGDAKLLASVSGVGKKTAERLVLELQHKVPEHLAAAGPASRRVALQSTAAQDATDALLALGFREAQVRATLSELLSENPEQTPDQLIRKALGRLR